MITRELLQEVAISVLEDAAFVFPEPAESSGSWPEVAARISFHGEDEGQVALAVDADLAREIAANLLGLDTGDGEAEGMRQAAIAELLNIVAGALVARAFGTRTRTRLWVPGEGVPASEASLQTELCVGASRLRLGVFHSPHA